MIRSFRDSETLEIHHGKRTKRACRRLPIALWERAQVKPDELDAATALQHLRLPSNRLHKLRGGRKGQHAIWINRQYRICFEWRDRDAWNVEIVDYH